MSHWAFAWHHRLPSSWLCDHAWSRLSSQQGWQYMGARSRFEAWFKRYSWGCNDAGRWRDIWLHTHSQDQSWVYWSELRALIPVYIFLRFLTFCLLVLGLIHQTRATQFNIEYGKRIWHYWALYDTRILYFVDGWEPGRQLCFNGD